MRCLFLSLVIACGSNSSPAMPDVPGSQGDGSNGSGIDAAIDAPASLHGLGTVTGVTNLSGCGQQVPTGTTCRKVTVTGCPGIESEQLDATIGFLPASGTLNGTIVHFSGGAGDAFEARNSDAYQAAGFQQVFVAWQSAWEQTTVGIKTAACRPATILSWVFNEPTLQNASRSTAFCGQGFSGGSAQLGYALAQYGMGDYLDYVNELSGPPFARIDLGCDYSQPASAQVCNAADTMQLDGVKMNPWENTISCGTTNPPAADVAKWMNDSISIGGTYQYPHTRVEFFDCTNRSTAVTAMAQIYENQLQAAGTDTAYHCYTQADNCSGEMLGTGEQASSDAMTAITGCTPRH